MKFFGSMFRRDVVAVRRSSFVPKENVVTTFDRPTHAQTGPVGMVLDLSGNVAGKTDRLCPVDLSDIVD